MKLTLLPLLCLIALMAGCSTVNSRIEEKSSVFNTLAPETQTRLKQSIIKIGDTTDMVYIAVGAPDRILETTTAEGVDLIWSYNAYTQEYEGRRCIGYRRCSYYDSYAKTWRIYDEPLHTDMYRDRVEEYMRVIFRADKVTTIEQIKR